MTEEDGVPTFQDIIESQLGVPAGLGSGAYEKRVNPETLALLLPQYEEWEVLGAGGMGIVYKAWHKELRRWAAVKFLSPDHGHDPRAMARFQNEATVLAQLRHLNIVPVHDFGTDGDLTWLVMDFVNGVPLSHWRRQAYRNESEMAGMMAKIARAAGVAHAAGIIHRDLKPGNILVIHDEPIILDFGLAHADGLSRGLRLTQTGEFAGTVGYLAPEQVDPELGEICPATDVHACGVILFELISRRLPREGPAVQVLNRLTKEDKPPRLRIAAPKASIKLEAICWQAMQKNPEHRYSNGISMAEDLERFVAGRTIRARTPDLLDQAYAYVRRYPWAVAATCLALSALALAGWSAARMRWTEKRAELLGKISREMTTPEWSSGRLKNLQAMLKEMHELDTVFERHIQQDIVKRVRIEATELLDEPRLDDEKTAHLRYFIDYLQAEGDGSSVELIRRLTERESAWVSRVRLVSPMSSRDLSEVFRPGGWELKDGALRSVPKAEESWNTLYSLKFLNGAAMLEAEFGPGWQKAKALGLSLIMPPLQNLRFYVFQADRFDRYMPGFKNPEREPVVAILAEASPLAFARLPASVANSPRLHLTCRYEGGDLTVTANQSLTVRHTRVFEMARPLTKAHFSILLPEESPLEKLEISVRKPSQEIPPFSKADELMGSGKAEEALRIYEEYLNRGDLQHECRYKYASCLDLLGRRQEAFHSWEQVASKGIQPWSKLALLQLWRSHLVSGDTHTADSWFDILAARGFDKDLLGVIPTADKMLLNQHYLPVSRSLNCLKARPSQLAAMDRAVQVQMLLGANAGQIALRNAMAFHFAGQDQRARQMYAQAALSVRPSAVAPADTLLQTMLCLDQWASLGRGDSDALLQPAITAWLHSLRASTHPARAVPFLEDTRRELRQGALLQPNQRQTLEELLRDSTLMLRHQAEGWLLKGLLEPTTQEQLRAWAKAVERLNAPPGKDDQTQQRLHTEFVARGLADGWTQATAADWLTALIGKSLPVVKETSWASPLIQSLVADGLDTHLNRSLKSPEGMAFARAYILRSRPARELAREAMTLIIHALLSGSRSFPDHHQITRLLAEQVTESYCAGNLDEITLMQLLKASREGREPPGWQLTRKALKPSVGEAFEQFLKKLREPSSSPPVPDRNLPAGNQAAPISAPRADQAAR